MKKVQSHAVGRKRPREDIPSNKPRQASSVYSWELNEKKRKVRNIPRISLCDGFGSPLSNVVKPSFKQLGTRVRFADEPVTLEVPPRSIQCDATDLWYSAEDLHRIHRECDQTVDMVKSGLPLFEDDWCKRGLESEFRVNLPYLKSKEAIINDVLDKQVDLWSKGSGDNTDILAAMCARYSAPHAMAAAVMGRYDWKSAQATNHRHACICTCGLRKNLERTVMIVEDWP